MLEEGDERHSLLPPSSLCFCLISARTGSSLLAPTHTETISFIPQVNQKNEAFLSITSPLGEVVPSVRRIQWYFETWLLHNRRFKNGRMSHSHVITCSVSLCINLTIDDPDLRSVACFHFDGGLFYWDIFDIFNVLCFLFCIYNEAVDTFH